MPSFVATVLVCVTGTLPADCTEATALVARSTVVENEIECAWGWQEVIARGEAMAGSEPGTYLKTICERREEPER